MSFDTLISVITMIAVISTAYYTGGLFRNDSRRMQRKKIIIEPTLQDDPALPQGWRWWTAHIRNPQPTVAARVSGARPARWRDRWRDVRISAANAVLIDDGYGTIGRPDFDNAGPTADAYAHANPQSSTTLRLAVYGVKRASDIALIWEWADYRTDD